jgi:predicted nucleic acid-binding protein
MSALTLDASAATRAVLETTERAALLDRISGAEAVYAPSLFVVETANALWKYVNAKRLSEESALRLHREATALVDKPIDDAELFPEAFLVAAQLRHPVYDALYLVTARRTGSTLMTADKALADLARKLGVDVAAT